MLQSAENELLTHYKFMLGKNFIFDGWNQVLLILVAALTLVSSIN